MTETSTAQFQGPPERCGAVLDRGAGERPRRVTCVNPKGHDGRHLATWGGSQKWRQQEWSDEPSTPVIGDYERGLRDAWALVDRAVRPLGYGPGQGSNSPWNAGYEQAKTEAQSAIWKAIQAQMEARNGT